VLLRRDEGSIILVYGPIRRVFRIRALSVCTLLLSLVTSACALDPGRDIHQFAHRSWGQKEGYPGRTQALVQTTDGYLWLGTDSGVFRFDGVHFDRYSPKSGDKLRAGSVSNLAAFPDGSLWIAFRTGNQICELRNDYLRCYGKLDGITSNPIAIVQDHEGAIWAHTDKGLIRFNGTRWENIGEAWNYPEDVPHTGSTALFVDSHGTLWAGVKGTVLYLKQGSKRFEPTGVFAGWSVSMAETSDGTIWLADNRSYVRAIGTSVSARSAAIARCEVKSPGRVASNCANEDSMVIKVSVPIRLLTDRNGNLWITTDTSGVFRVSHPERLREGPVAETSDELQSFSSKDGLSADNCTPVLEDREGNIWVATRDGLDQFRDTALASVLLPTSFSRISIAPADGGDIWVGSRGYVVRIHGNSGETSIVRTGAFQPYSDPAGNTWLIGYSLEQWKGGSFHRAAPSPGGHSGGFGSWQAAGDKSGTLWAFFDGHGFFSLDHGRWKTWATPPEVAKQEVTSIFSDSTGLIWVSTFEGHVITMDRGKIIEYSKSPLRYVKVFAEHAPHEIWAGGSGGLAVIDSGQFRLMKPAVVDLPNDVTGILDAGRDGLWLNTADGVVHISSAEVDHALRDPAYRFHSERFDSFDGIPGQSEVYPFATAIQGTDGRIWFTATKGVAWVDPKKKIPRNAIPPPVHIERIVADDKEYEVSNRLRLPAHVRDLSIDYTALSLAVPEKVHFKVKLEGQDNDWRDLINVRHVGYTNLLPRSYRFRVMACNNSGVWNQTGASLEFSIAPAYYQTTWFKILCATAFAALLWALYQLRLHQIRQQALLLQHLPVSAWTLKPDGTPDFVNQVWLEFAGQTLDFVRSQPEAWMAAVHPEDREAASRIFWDAVRSGKDFAFETRSLRARDGTWRWHLQQAVALRDEEGKVLKFVGTTTDIDDQKRAEDASRQTQSDLARVNRVTTMGELAASLAHELSQPISGAMTNASVGIRKLGSDNPSLEEVRGIFARIVRDTQRAAEIIGRIRSQFEKGALKQESLDANEIIAETIALLRDEAVRHNISVRTELANDLPQIIGDRVQLQQVAMNLIINSIEAMKDFDGIREIVIQSQRAPDEQILVSISDTGMGIPPQFAERIFDPFFTTKAHGTGMGLRICRSIIESHGGHLWAGGSQGRGATFHFNLPAAIQD
jgi:PAS domain S-box-containing protein